MGTFVSGDTNLMSSANLSSPSSFSASPDTRGVCIAQLFKTGE